jgi:hypothetical protein
MASSDFEEWHPGSFTKNYSWGSDKGLRNLYESIRLGFGETLQDVPRATYRERVAQAPLPDYIPINFFLFNYTSEAGDMLLADELVFQALNFEHSDRFDHLALFALILSLAGTWSDARPYQRRPALWAHHYVGDRVGSDFNWDASRVSADDIEKFVMNDARYRAKSARKLATNLNFLFRVGGLRNYASKRVERWWVDALFLTLDRALASRKIDGCTIRDRDYETYVAASGFNLIAGRRSVEKDLASKHVINLYRACGGNNRFDPDAVYELTRTNLAYIQNWIANDSRPVAALHPSNPRIVKTIPRACAMLAKFIGFLTFDVDQLAELSISDLVRENLESALARLRDQGVVPTMSAEEFMKLMRGS